MNQRFAWVISGLVVLFLSVYYFVVLARPISLNLVNAVVAFSSTFVIGFSFLLGPLARLTGFFRPLLSLRKPFGLIGFGLAALHALLVVPVQLGNMREIGLGDVASLVFAGMAFMVFTLMSLTSTQNWMEKLGYENWKNLQRTGYLAFAFVLFHIVLLEHGVFLSRTTGQFAIAFILLCFFLRALLLFLAKPNTEKINI